MLSLQFSFYCFYSTVSVLRAQCRFPSGDPSLPCSFFLISELDLYKILQYSASCMFGFPLQPDLCQYVYAVKNNETSYIQVSQSSEAA